MTLTFMGAFTVTGGAEELAVYTGAVLDILKKMNDRFERDEIDDAIKELMRNTKPNRTKGDVT